MTEEFTTEDAKAIKGQITVFADKLQAMVKTGFEKYSKAFGDLHLMVQANQEEVKVVGERLDQLDARINAGIAIPENPSPATSSLPPSLDPDTVSTFLSKLQLVETFISGIQTIESLMQDNSMVIVPFTELAGFVVDVETLIEGAAPTSIETATDILVREYGLRVCDGYLEALRKSLRTRNKPSLMAAVTDIQKKVKAMRKQASRKTSSQKKKEKPVIDASANATPSSDKDISSEDPSEEDEDGAAEDEDGDAEDEVFDDEDEEPNITDE